MAHATEPRTVPLIEIRVATPLTAEFAGAVDRLLDDAVTLRPARLVVDLSECEYVDATGIALLLDVHRRIWRDGGRLTLQGMSPRLHRILHIARVDRVLHAATAPHTIDPAARSGGLELTRRG
jgi:anti-anti-sigma factor